MSWRRSCANTTLFSVRGCRRVPLFAARCRTIVARGARWFAPRHAVARSTPSRTLPRSREKRLHESDGCSRVSTRCLRLSRSSRAPPMRCICRNAFDREIRLVVPVAHTAIGLVARLIGLPRTRWPLRAPSRVVAPGRAVVALPSPMRCSVAVQSRVVSVTALRLLTARICCARDRRVLAARRCRGSRARPSLLLVERARPASGAVRREARRVEGLRERDRRADRVPRRSRGSRGSA